jgi:hypothetical protein
MRQDPCRVRGGNGRRIFPCIYYYQIVVSVMR